MYEAIPYFVNDRALDKPTDNKPQIKKVSEKIVSPFTVKVVSDIIKNTNGNIQPPTKISSSNAEDCIALEVRQILGKFNMT